MPAKDGDIVWFYEQYHLQLSTVTGYQPIKGKVIRTVLHATTGLTTVDVLLKDPSVPAARANKVYHNVAYVDVGARTPLTGYYAVADKGDGTGPGAVTPEDATHIAPPTLFKPAKGVVEEAPSGDVVSETVDPEDSDIALG